MWALFWASLLLHACHNTVNHKHAIIDSVKIKEVTDSTVIDTPIMGYRFTLIGDFNGDGKKDTFIEHFYSEVEHQETNKFFSGKEDIYDLDKIKNRKEVRSFFLCSNPSIDTLYAGGVIGPLFIKNEGDLDGDGGDEIGYVPSLPQMSSMNEYYVLSLKHNEWVVLYSFEIREWELPPLPEAGRSYGLFGSDGMYHVMDDSMNREIEKNLETFHDLLKKLKGGRIKVKTFTKEVEDTFVIVNLKPLKGKTFK